MSLYQNEPAVDGRDLASVGVLLVNLGTPDAPTAPALRRFLREFLGDPRVIEEPRLKWWLVLNLFILPFRPRRSAELYRKVWQEDGSPLLTYSLGLRDAVAEALAAQETGVPLHVAAGMRYGEPSLAGALAELRAKGCRKLLVLPLFPQYSGTTTASVFDAVTAELTTWRVVPELRTIHQYHDDPAYVEALADSVRETWRSGGEPDKLLMSFHGIPLRYDTGGDPYQSQCRETARLVRESLGLDEERCVVSFQSIFGKEEWIRPATDATIAALAQAGVERLDVLCPGFSVDCLETLEEIDQLNREIFLGNGGRQFRYIPCLNDRASHAETIAGLVCRNLGGWTERRENQESLLTGVESWKRSA
jgi:ferrochelatase